MAKISVLILGAGGHSKVLIDCLKSNKNINVIGMLDLDTQLHGTSVLGFPVLGDENEILKQCSPSSVKLINGIGSTGSTAKREHVFNKFKKAGYDFLEVVHPNSYVAENVILEEGVQIITRSVIQPGCHIGKNVIINTNASIDHDCKIGDHAHIAPGVICCGGVTIGKGTHVGSGAVLLQSIHIGDNCLIAAGAVVTRDIGAVSKVAGVPARTME
jgi:sugar O-acyltransferase (sialic acid O-acetyltransferase NeuD family)